MPDPADIAHERFLITYGAFESSKQVKADAYKIGSSTQMAYELRLYEDIQRQQGESEGRRAHGSDCRGLCAAAERHVRQPRSQSVVMFGVAGNSGVSNLGTCKFDATRTTFDKTDAFEKLPAGDKSFCPRRFRGRFASRRYHFPGGRHDFLDTLDGLGPA